MKAAEDLRKAGAIVVDPVRVGLDDIQHQRGAGASRGFRIRRSIGAAAGDRVPVKNLAAIIQSRRFHPTVQRRLEQGQDGHENGPDTPACAAEAAYRQQVRAAVLKTMDAEKLDAFVYPTWSNPPRLIGDLNTPHGDNSQFFSPTTGFPSINVPMGYTRNNTLPAGITFFGRAWDEAGLITLAYAYNRPPAIAVRRAYSARDAHADDVAHLTVQDVERSLSFYRDQLGLEQDLDLRDETGALFLAERRSRRYGDHAHAGARKHATGSAAVGCATHAALRARPRHRRVASGASGRRGVMVCAPMGTGGVGPSRFHRVRP